MDAQLKQKWLEALRGGQYEQGFGELCAQTTNGLEYCCLGVLAEVAGIERSNLFNNDHLSRIGRDDLLGPWGTYFISNDPTTHATLQQKLAGMNDADQSFAQIADWIEANIPAEVSQS